MMRSMAIGATVAALLAAPCGVAHAGPAAPSADTPCTADLDGAMTLPTGAKTPLVCGGATWEPVTDPYPISAKWVSSGPAMTLHGQGRPNPNLLSGAWTATPLSPETSCGATQLAVIPGSPTVGAPRVDRAAVGQPLSFDVVPILFTIEMSGDCLWQQASQPTA
jgi:hypothetical protein